MSFALSDFGSKFGDETFILRMMDDLSQDSARRDVVAMAGGNPAVPARLAQRVLHPILASLANEATLLDLLCRYPSPSGGAAASEAVAEYLRGECGWDVGPANICFTNGSQSALFWLVNMFSAGSTPDAQVYLPFAPEYVGYRDLLLEPGRFVQRTPAPVLQRSGFFRYEYPDIHPDPTNIAAILLSRPANPTGRSTSSYEMEAIGSLANEWQVPLIVDLAYGAPFPGLDWSPTSLDWNAGMVLTMSLSKLGLPGARAGLVVADHEIVQRLRGCSAVSQLAPNALGIALLKGLCEHKEWAAVRDTTLVNFYRSRFEDAAAAIHQMDGTPTVNVHQSDGSMFLWGWLPAGEATGMQLAATCRDRGLSILPGEHFFFGSETGQAGSHTQHCFRLTLTPSDADLSLGLDRLHRGLRLLSEGGKEIACH